MNERIIPAQIRDKNHCALHLAGTDLDDPIIQKFLNYFNRAKQLKLDYPRYLSFVLFSPQAFDQGALLENHLGHHNLEDSLTQLIDIIDRHEFLLSQPN